MAKRGKAAPKTAATASAAAQVETIAFTGSLGVATLALWFGTGAISTLGLLLAAALIVWGVVRALALPPRLVPVLGLGALVGVWYLFTSARAVNPLVSALGGYGQHNGVALWILGLAWLVAGAMWSDRVALRWPLRLAVAAGAIVSAAVYLEALTTGMRGRDYPAGVFESSSSAGQFLAITMVVAIASGLSERSTALRWASWITVALCGGAMVVASARIGVGAVLVGVAVAWLTSRFGVVTRRPVVTATLATLLPAAATAFAYFAYLGTMGSAVQGVVGAFLTGRGFIWRAAVAHYLQNPILGAGLQQFSAWTDFFNLETAAPTADPHSVFFALLLGGGVIGAILALAAGIALFTAVFDAARGRTLAANLTLMLPLTLLTSALVSWIHPSAMLVTCAITGLALGKGAGTEAAAAGATRAWVKPLLVGVAAVAAIAGLALLYSMPGQITYASSSSPDQMLALYKRWPDPTYAVAALRIATPAAEQGDPQAKALLEQVLAASARDGRWRVELAGAQLQAVRAIDPDNASRFPEYVAVVDRGREADPKTPVWDVLLAAEAKRLGLTEQARAYAKASLAYELGADVRAQMEKLAQ